MIASLNIVTKTFAGLLSMIITTRRRPILIIHLEEKYAKTDYKNEIYAKNWVRIIWTAKVNDQSWLKSIVNSRS